MFPDDIPEPNPSGDALSSEAKRGLIIGHIDALLTRAYTQSEALAFYRERGLGIRSSDFATIYNSSFSNYNLAKSVQVAPYSEPLTEDFLGGGKSSNRGKYLYVAEITYLDLTADEEQTGYFGYHSNQLLSPSQIEDLIQYRATYSDSYRGSEVVDTKLIRGYKLEQ